MSKTIQFGESVQGFSIPVLNEREIRAGAGFLFLMIFISVIQAGQGNFTPIKYSVTIFMTDMMIRLFINPKYSPFLFLGRFMVRNQKPEYVGAEQKKYAWYIGLGISSVIFTMMVLGNTFSPVSGIACMICLIFLFFETAFGICIGCKIYSLIKKEKAQYCPGEVCDLKNKDEIQKITNGQLLSAGIFILGIFVLVFFFNDFYSMVPVGILGAE